MRRGLGSEEVETQVPSESGLSRSSQSQVVSQTQLSSCDGDWDSDYVNSVNKRLKTSDVIVYTRRAKLRNRIDKDAKSEVLERSEGLNSELSSCNGVVREENGSNCVNYGDVGIGLSGSLEEKRGNELVEVVVREDLTCIGKRPRVSWRKVDVVSDDGLVDVFIGEDRGRLSALSRKGERDDRNVYMHAESSSSEWRRRDFPEKVRMRRRSIGSLLKEEEVKGVVDMLDVSGSTKFEATLGGDGEAAAETDELSTPRKLEMKMSKKISVSKKLMTVRDLFETGLLDGVTVVYMGGNMTKSSGLRGTIRDGGILCSCSICNGCRVIPPSQFEIHACKVYKRAAQYICFENGKSLLEVLKACRSCPLHKLEDTVKSVVYSQAVEKFFTCRRCKGTFPASSVARTGPLCSACVELKRSQSSPTSTTGKRPRLVKAVTVSEPSTTPTTSLSLQGSNKWIITTRSSKNPLIPKTAESAPARISSIKKISCKIMTKSAKPVLISNHFRGPYACCSPKKKRYLKRLKKSRKPVAKLNFCSGDVAPLSAQKKSQWKITIKDQRLHKLVFEEGGLPDGTEVAYYARGKRILEGYKSGLGIFCQCCNCEVSPSQFEAHAGWSSRRKPYSNIYTSNGVSLHELAISLSKDRKYSARDNDNLCVICADGGDLVLCDGCPRAFHKECASLTSIPQGDWYCDYCQSLFQREKFVNANSVAAGRVAGVDPIDEIYKRCIRIVKNVGAEIIGCVLCRGYDFSKSGFGPRTIIICDQCEKEFHVGCLRDHKMAILKELPKGKWFCSVDCSRIHYTLQNLLLHDAEKLQDPLVDIIKKKHEKKGLGTIDGFDVRWRLLSGSFASPDSRKLLSEAVSIFHECFDPIVDVMTGRDLIPSMVYGRSTRGQEYGGMYCAVLIVNSIVVSAGILRVFGEEIAELPLVATRKCDHDKGYFQLLFYCIEKLLAFLNVRNLMLPAAAEAESIWIDKFGFRKIESDELKDYRWLCSQMVTFKGTSMLQKPVLGCRYAVYES